MLIVLAESCSAFGGEIQTTDGSGPAPQTSEITIWTNGLGNGFRPGVQTLNGEAGGSYGLNAFGSRQAHHLVLGSLSYGYMRSPVRNADHWYRGNWEWRAELFGGEQFSPTDDWILGLTPHLRYNLATGTRLIPFVDGGAGVTFMRADQPDLSSDFEFNLQGGTGVHYFVRNNLAVTVEARYFHISDAGIRHPNYGLNGVGGMIGLTWFF
jgi:hypothetical protein